MNSDLIESPFCRTTPPIRLEADYRKISAEHSRSADRAGVLKIDCLPNDPAPGFFKLAPSGSGVRAQNCVTRMEEKRCCTENTAPCSRYQQMGTPRGQCWTAAPFTKSRDDPSPHASEVPLI